MKLISKIVAVVMLGILFGVAVHSDKEKKIQLGREMFVAEQAKHWDRNYMNSYDVVTSSILGAATGAIVIGIYELTTLCVYFLFRSFLRYRQFQLTPATKCILWLLLANLVFLPLLCVPSFGFISWMNLHGILVFIIIAWLSGSTLAFVFWPHVSRVRSPIGYLLVFTAAVVPALLGWGIALHTLYWRDASMFPNVLAWMRDTVFLGALSTATYWLPASAINYFVLRRYAV